MHHHFICFLQSILKKLF